MFKLSNVDKMVGVLAGMMFCAVAGTWASTRN